VADNLRRAPSDTAAPPFTQNQLRGIAKSMVNLILANVLYAISGISIFGVEPFDGLKGWADELVATANDAYYNASVAQSSADYANAQITGLIPTDVSGGVSVNSTFDGPAGTSIGASFTQEYIDGPGSGTWGLDGSGNTKWNKSGGSWRVCIARHVTPTATEFQRVRIVLASKPESPNFGGTPRNYLCGRINSAATTFVYASVSYNNLQIGCYNSGTDTVLKTVSHTPNVGDVYDLYIGTDVDDYEFIVKRNGTEVTRHTDSGHVSQKDSSHLGVGLGCVATDKNVFTGQAIPGAVTAWGGLDRQPTSY